MMNMNLRSALIGAGMSFALLIGYSFRPAPEAQAFTYKQFSTIESVVPGGLGRSRIIISDQSNQDVEKDLMNFYSMTGINFKNVANNDKLIVDNINDYTAAGWELYKVTTGVQSNDKTGIFITRYLFRKPV